MMLEIAYYLLFAFCVVLIGWGFIRATLIAGMPRQKAISIIAGYYIIMAVWVAYLWLLTNSDLLDMNARPPKLPVLVLLPAFSIIGWFFISKKFKQIIDAFPTELTVYYQTFRIVVEILIYGAYLKGLGPVQATFDGYNFDILAGITAPLAGWLTFHKKIVTRRGLLIWNILCLLLLANIVTIFITLLLAPGVWGYDYSPIKQQFFTLPYIFIAAFYMPSAVFMHIFSIRKILRQKL